MKKRVFLLSVVVLFLQVASVAIAAKSDEAVLNAYEKVRAELAADDLKGAVDAGKDLRSAAQKALAGAASERKEALAVVESAAKSLSASGELDTARNAFGKASNGIISLMKADPSLAKGRTVYECGMWEGDNKWVQAKGKKANPFMGKEMLTCGMEAK